MQVQIARTREHSDPISELITGEKWKVTQIRKRAMGGSFLRLLCIALVHVKAEAADLPCLIGSVAKSSLGAGYSRLVVFAQGLRPSYGQSDQEMIGTAM